MEIEKLNACLAEMDTLSKVFIDYETVSAEIRFNCLSGGAHENVNLYMKLSDPLYYQLPFSLEGEFQVTILPPDKLNQILPHEFCEPNLKALCISVEGKNVFFYCCFTELEWSVSGGGTIINEHELMPC